MLSIENIPNRNIKIASFSFIQAPMTLVRPKSLHIKRMQNKKGPSSQSMTDSCWMLNKGALTLIGL